MDFTPYLLTPEAGPSEEGLLSVEIPGRVAVAMKGRFLLRAVFQSFGEQNRITCAVTDQDSCLAYLAAETDPAYELLICTDYLETGNGFELVRLAKLNHPKLHCVVLALGDVIPAEYAEAPWLEAVVPRPTLWKISNR
jgi:hypothetical protein